MSLQTPRNVPAEKQKFITHTHPPNYQSVGQNRKEGWIAAIFSTQLVYTDIDLGELTSFEYLALELKGELSVDFTWYH